MIFCLLPPRESALRVDEEQTRSAQFPHFSVLILFKKFFLRNVQVGFGEAFLVGLLTTIG